MGDRMATFWTDLKTQDPTISVIVTQDDRNGTIVAVGDDRLMTQRRATDRVVALSGFVTPGFWDRHVHLLEYARSLDRLFIADHASYADVLASVAQQLKTLPPGEWLIGAGWNREALGREPDPAALDALSSRHPILLMSLDYHSAWLNRLALSRLELAQEDIMSARRTGLLREKAAFAAQDQAQSHIGVDVGKAVARLNQLGLVGVTAIERQEGWEAIQTYQQRHRNLRVELYLYEDVISRGLDRSWHESDPNFLKMVGVKLFADGALGSHSAWMMEPYADDSTNYGIPLMDESQIRQWLQQLSPRGLDLAVHAIGDRAVAETTAAFIHEAGRPMGRIEHAQLISDDVLNRLAGEAVTLSMQPTHLYVDRPIAERHWGDRSRYAFRFRDILDRGIPLVFGSDAPIASPDPRWGLWAAVHRARPGSDPWYPQQRISPEQALECYTSAPSTMGGAGNRLLQPGAWGDFTVWRADPRRALSQGEFNRLEVVATVVAGQQVY